MFYVVSTISLFVPVIQMILFLFDGQSHPVGGTLGSAINHMLSTEIMSERGGQKKTIVQY